MNKLEMAYELLGDVINKQKEKKRVQKKYCRPDWGDVVKGKISKKEYEVYWNYHPYQLEQQLVVVRRLIQEGKSEI